MNAPFRPCKGLIRLPLPWLVAASMLVLAAAIEVPRPQTSNRNLIQKSVVALELARNAGDCLLQAKRTAGIKADSPWLGEELTPLVTTLGSLEAKQVAANPDWARVLTLQLYNAGVRPGSVVTAGCSGSFPALNLSLACACQALGADLIAITSVTASTWGANQPGFTWPEIEARLVRAGIIRPISIGISLGGDNDAALDLEPSARALAEKIQQSAAAELGVMPLTAATLKDSISQRMKLYRECAAGRPVALYVNVGGSEASIGDSAASWRLESGFISGKPFDLSPQRGVIARFAEDNVPTLSLLHIEGLAFRWGVTPL